MKAVRDQGQRHVSGVGAAVIDIIKGNKTLSLMPGPPIYHPRGVNVVPLPRWGYLHVLCDMLVPKTRVIVVLPLMSSITTVRMCPRDFLLDCCPPFIRSPLFRAFTLLSTDLSVKSAKSAGIHGRGAQIKGSIMWVVSGGGV